MEGRKPFKYQEEGADALLSFMQNNPSRAALLADPPGAGKTVQAILVAKALQCKSVLIVCPASLRLNWAREVEMWWPEYSGPVSVVRSRKDTFDTRGIVVVSYNLAASGALGQWRWDLLILDEAHACKNPSSNTSRACLVTMWNACKYRLAMTGTPVPNGRAYEAWTLFSRILPSHFTPVENYLSRYCIPEHTEWGLTYPRSKNLEELGRIAREHFMVRRRKEDIMGQLPPMVRSRIPIEIGPKAIQDALEGLEVATEEVVYSIDMNMPLRSDALSTARRKLGILKVPGALKYLQEVVLEETKKAVVFCHHREVFFPLLEALREKGVGVVTVNGETSLDARQRAVDAFQDDGSGVRIFLASITAANAGITLTAADTVVFVESSWIPAVNEQAEGRILRVGQKAELLRAQYLVVAESLDEAVMWSVHRKQRDISKVMQETS